MSMAKGFSRGTKRMKKGLSSGGGKAGVGRSLAKLGATAQSKSIGGKAKTLFTGRVMGGSR